ncbi:LCP family protein [Devriesea agamarum]|uniref:LCP family protein n=1 Tax=Devriesea agamarum TaxID=472569 RepID=UPI00071E0BF0|nr:LCP family protein [Devriesea agamarum]
MPSNDTPLPETPESAPPRGRRRRRRGLRIAIWTICSLLVVAGIAAGIYVIGFSRSLSEIKRVDIAGQSQSDRPAKDAGKGTNFLILGSDRRDPEEAKASHVTGQRSDTIMLVHVSADKKSAYVISFPRDLWIDIPGRNKERINAALAFGGVPLAVQTVENYAGVPIDHVAMIDFNGVKGLVDKLGGVDVNSSKAFTINGDSFHQGINHLNGEQALSFVRARKQFAEGDFQRNTNQRELLKAVLNKVISADTLTDPMKIQGVVATIAPYLTVDSDLTNTAMVQLGYSLRDLRTSNIYYLSAPHGEPFMTSGGASVVAENPAAMDQLRKALKDDDMAAYYSSTTKQ